MSRRCRSGHRTAAPRAPAAVNLAAFGHVPAGGSRVRLESLQVAATSPPGMLATYRGDQIVPLLLVIGADRPTRTLEPGQRAVVFLDLTFPRTGNIPPHFEHRLVLTVGEGSAAERQTMDGIAVKLGSRAPIRIDRPLAGKDLLAGNGCCAKSDHARAVHLADEGPKRSTLKGGANSSGAPGTSSMAHSRQEGRRCRG